MPTFQGAILDLPPCDRAHLLVTSAVISVVTASILRHRQQPLRLAKQKPRIRERLETHVLLPDPPLCLSFSTSSPESRQIKWYQYTGIDITLPKTIRSC